MASIKCGSCGRTHGSVQDVKACHAGRTVATVTAPVSGGWRDDPASDKQLQLLKRLREEAKAPAKFTGQITKGQASAEIEELKSRKPASAAPERKTYETPARRDFSAVTGGYYATVSATGNNDYDFWYVKEGRKPGYRFVKRYLGGSGPIRISGGEAIRALCAILDEGVEKCGLRFADEHQRCWKCGLPLTDELSRSRRQGPVCWAKN